MKRGYWVLLSWLSIIPLKGQIADTISIRGVVLEAESGELLQAATIALFRQIPEQTDQFLKGTISDATGSFYFDNLSPGTYALEVSFTGLQTARVTQIILPASGRVSFEFNLKSEVIRFEEINVNAPVAVSELKRSKYWQQLETTPGTFNDPGRLATRQPGVVQANDQANHLVVNGNSPNKVIWRLNELAIVNPNHTSNAGTISDNPTLSGGGVNAISTQLLDYSQLYTADAPNQFGNSLGGTMAMELSPPRGYDRRFQAQASLIGLDVAAQGLFDRKNINGWSYNATYRYSFTGLLADLGADFGGETIRFQDAGLQLHKWQKGGGRLSIFGIWGNSSNRFRGPEDPEEREEEKDLSNIDFESDLAIAGFRWQRPLGNKLLTIGGAFSTTNPSREQSAVVSNELERSLRFSQERENFMARLSADSWSFGLDYLRDRMTNQELAMGSPVASQEYGLAVERFALNASHSWGNQRFALELGLEAGLYQFEFAEPFFNPKVAMSFGLGSAEVGLNFQTFNHYPLENQLRPAMTRALANQQVVSHQLELNYGGAGPQTFWEIGLFGQYTPEEEVQTIDGFQLGANNNLAIDPFGGLRLFEVASRRYGLNWEFQRTTRDLSGWLVNLNGAFFRAETQQADGEWTADRWSYGWIAQGMVSRTWSGTTKRGLDRSRGISFALIGRGGERTPFLPDDANNLPADAQLGEPYYGFGGLVEQLPTYIRPDLRLFRTVNRPKTRITLSLDIQNVAGLSNVGSRYYDNFTMQVEEREQLGFIPVLSYRVEWR
ncbi:MAG: carboxypeptidase-like regulatory domain-containing protein [Bacteroidota bacterium]